VKGIADTGLLVAFANRHDRHHDWAVSIAEQVSEPLFTCEPALAEAAFHLQSVALVLAMIRDGLITLAFDCNDRLVQRGNVEPGASPNGGLPEPLRNSGAGGGPASVG
jgi:hypothetical protein